MARVLPALTVPTLSFVHGIAAVTESIELVPVLPSFFDDDMNDSKMAWNLERYVIARWHG